MLHSLSYGFHLTEATFLRRKNRFIAVVLLENEEVEVHLANTGRMREILIQGRTCLLKPANATQKRKTQWTLWLIEYHNQWVCLQASYANTLLYHALSQGILPGLQEAKNVKCEVKADDVRFDFSFMLKDKTYMAEVKSVNLITQKRGCFPDAPTKRGTHHIERLHERWSRGEGAALLFLTMGQRADAVCLQAVRDPQFTKAVHDAWIEGLPIFAYEAKFTPTHVLLQREIVFGG